MQVKINEKIISIPPYISTTWAHVSSLRMQGNSLVITLLEGGTITIPDLTPNNLELIFNCHAAYLETPVPQQMVSFKNHPIRDLLGQSESPVHFSFGSIDGVNPIMKHDPAQADAPDLPPELLQKISAISKVLIQDEISVPRAEPSCNCYHCQIARAFHPPETVSAEAVVEEVSENELEFQQWNISQIGEKLFSVTSRLDEKEKFSVYLGQPIGCTCGKQGCEHIVAVLKS